MPAPLSVLLVDDDVSIQHMLCSLFRQHGVTVEPVGDGETALRQLRDHDYDVVLLDMLLPNTNGFEVVRHLKAVSPEVLSRVIVMTAASRHTMQFFDDRDVRRLMHKPFDIHELMNEVLACGSQTKRRAM